MEAWRTSVPVVPIVPVVLIAPVVPIVPVVLIAPVVPIVPVFPIAPIVPIIPVVPIAPVVLITPVVLIVSNVSMFQCFSARLTPSWRLIRIRALVTRREGPRSPLAVFFSTPYGSMSARVSQEAASWSTRSSSVSQKPGLAVVGAAVSRQAAMWAQRFSWRVCMET